MGFRFFLDFFSFFSSEIRRTSTCTAPGGGIGDIIGVVTISL